MINYKNITEKLEYVQLFEKLRWIFDHFEPYLGDFHDSEIDEVRKVLWGKKYRYWTIFSINIDNFTTRFGYSINFNPNFELVDPYYVRGMSKKSFEKLPTVFPYNVLFCVDLSEKLVSNPILKTKDTMFTWYRMALREIKMPFYIPIDNKE